MPPLFRIHTKHTMRAQQRTSQRRRNKPNPGGVQIYTQDWEASQGGTYLVNIVLTMLPDGSPVAREGWVETDLLRWWNRTTGQYPTSAVATPGGWDLTFATAIPTNFTIVRMPNDDSLRGPGGIYLTGKAYQQAGFGPGPTPIEAIDCQILGTGVRFTLASINAGYAAKQTPDLCRLNSDTIPTLFAFGTNYMDVEWVTPTASGDSVEFAFNTSLMVNNDGGTAVNSVWTLP